MSNPTKEALGAAIAAKTDREMLALLPAVDTAQVCEAIATMPLLTISDAANIMHALTLRAANIPLTAPGRTVFVNELQQSHDRLLNLWSQG